MIDFAIRYFNLATSDVSGALHRLDGVGVAGSVVVIPFPAPILFSSAYGPSLLIMAEGAHGNIHRGFPLK